MNIFNYFKKSMKVIEKLDYTEYEYFFIELNHDVDLVTSDIFNIQDFKNLLIGLGYKEVFTLMKLTNGMFLIQNNKIHARVRKEHIGILESIHRTIVHVNETQKDIGFNKETYYNMVKKLYSKVKL